MAASPRSPHQKEAKTKTPTNFIHKLRVEVGPNVVDLLLALCALKRQPEREATTRRGDAHVHTGGKGNLCAQGEQLRPESCSWVQSVKVPGHLACGAPLVRRVFVLLSPAALCARLRCSSHWRGCSLRKCAPQVPVASPRSTCWCQVLMSCSHSVDQRPSFCARLRACAVRRWK